MQLPHHTKAPLPSRRLIPVANSDPAKDTVKAHQYESDGHEQPPSFKFVSRNGADSDNGRHPNEQIATELECLPHACPLERIVRRHARLAA
jgi:hypothetical protein